MPYLSQLLRQPNSYTLRFPASLANTCTFAGSAAFRATAPQVDLAYSTIFVRILSAPPVRVGATGFKGDIGRARLDFEMMRG